MIRLALSHLDMERLGIKKKSDRDKIRLDLYDQIRKNHLSNSPGVLFQYIRIHWFPILKISHNAQRYSDDMINEVIQLYLLGYTPSEIQKRTAVSSTHIKRIINRYTYGYSFGQQSTEDEKRIKKIQKIIQSIYEREKELSNDPKFSISKFYGKNSTLIRYHQYLFGPDRKIYCGLLRWYDSKYDTKFLPKRKQSLIEFS